MNVTELKAKLHSFIDQIENIVLLEDYYNEMKRILTSPVSKVWDTLPEEQKREILLSCEESEDDNNLVENSEVLKKYKKWL